VSYSIRSTTRAVFVSLDVPPRGALRTLSLRLRLPRGTSVTGVLLDGRRVERFDPRTATVELPVRPGRLELVARVERGSS
jgi:hypothetical protein